jgi:hypothetical protein
MDNPSVSDFAENQLVVGEKVLYQAPRKWSSLLETAIIFISFLFFTFVWFGLSQYLGNVTGLLNSLPNWMVTQSSVLNAQFINIMRWAALFLAVYSLLAMLGTIIVFFGAETLMTDRRVLGKTGRYVLRKVNIPLESISRVYFPNHIISKGPMVINTFSGKSTTFWSLGRPEEFIGLLEQRYPPQTKPIINRPVLAGKLVLLIFGLALLGLGLYLLYSNQNPTSALRKFLATNPIPATLAAPRVSAPRATRTPRVTTVPTATLIPTKRPTLTPTPLPVEVDFTTLNNYPVDTRVTMVGQMKLPGGMTCDEKCPIFFRNSKKYAEEITIFIYIPPEGEEPEPNMMARLPDKYRESDFKVRLDDGTFVGNYTKVRVTGSICETTSGEIAICRITKIERPA